MFRGCTCGYKLHGNIFELGKLTNQGDISRPIHCVVKVVLSSVTNQKSQKNNMQQKPTDIFPTLSVSGYVFFVLLSQNHTWLKTNHLLYIVANI